MIFRHTMRDYTQSSSGTALPGLLSHHAWDVRSMSEASTSAAAIKARPDALLSFCAFTAERAPRVGKLVNYRS